MSFHPALVSFCHQLQLVVTWLNAPVSRLQPVFPLRVASLAEAMIEVRLKPAGTREEPSNPPAKAGGKVISAQKLCRLN